MKQCKASTDVAATAHLSWQFRAALEQQESCFLLLGQHHACPPQDMCTGEGGNSWELVKKYFRLRQGTYCVL